MLCRVFFFFEGDGDHRDLHVLTHSFPTRRSSDLCSCPPSEPSPPGKFEKRHAPRIGVIDEGLLVEDIIHAQRQLHIAKAPRRLEVHIGERSEEHTSELQSLMRISYAVFCLKKKKTNNIPKRKNDTKSEQPI